jgi:nucleotide-binding universal stress UspA family protein
MARTLREPEHTPILAPDARAAFQEGLLDPEEARLLLLGSVAERVVRKAPCPVQTVRQEEHGSL